MLQLSKRKRMMILQQLTSKRERLPSAERRKMVENEYNQFVKTMNNFQNPNSSGFNFSAQQSRLTQQNSANINSNEYLGYSPTVAEISRPPTDRQALHNEFYEVEKEQKAQPQPQSPQKMEHINFYKNSTPQPHERPSSTHALNELRQEKSQQHSEAKVEDQQIQIPFANPSMPSSSVNNSEAIFFTSQFKNYIDRQPEPSDKERQPEPPVKIPEQPQEIRQPSGEKPAAVIEERVGEEAARQQKTLRTNRSGQSLVLSNDSSLKFSLNESAVHEAIAKKLTHELVIDSLGESRYAKNIQNLACSLIIRQNFKDIIELSKQVSIRTLLLRNQKKKLIEEMIVQKQMKYEVRKDQIKVQQFQHSQHLALAETCFRLWKNLHWDKQAAVRDFIEKREAATLVKSFRTLKMLLFDRKINSQVQMYYLSKMFFALKGSLQKESRRDRQKAYRLYFKNLKRRVFNAFVEGVHNRRRERENVEMADENYYFSLIRKAFDSWREFMPLEERYVRLAMTTQIQLRQTQDKRLIQTKTFDFKELK